MLVNVTPFAHLLALAPTLAADTALDYSVPMAIEDFVPVMFAGAGFFVIARLVAHLAQAASSLAYVGAIFATAGGLSKAVWKLTIAASENDIRALDALLFPLLTVGFVCLAAAVAAARRNNIKTRSSLARTWLQPGLVLAGIAIGAVGIGVAASYDAASNVMLAAVVVASTVALVQLILLSRSVATNAAVVLFGVNLILAYVLGWVGSMDQTIALQWVEQLLQTVAQLALLLGALALVRASSRAEANRVRSPVATS